MAKPNIIMTVPVPCGSGQHPSVCLHSEENIIVKVSVKWSTLYYRVGRVDKERMGPAATCATRLEAFPM
jgi:hypothetical protein